MDLEGEYAPSPAGPIAQQVERYEASGGTEANLLGNTDYPIIVVTTRGATSGKVRKTPLMRVVHDGEYLLVGSKGGGPRNPNWVHNLRAAPTSVLIQDGPAPFSVAVRELAGDERAEWWQRAVAAYPPYAGYQATTDRVIPLFLATRTDGEAVA